jgi:hypothetical protein
MTGFDHPSIAFDRPCDRPANAPAIAYSIDLLSASIDPTSIAPIPPERSNRSLGLGGPARLRPLEEEKGKRRKRARHRQVLVDSQQLTVRPITASTTRHDSARVTQRVFVLVRYQGPPNSRTNPRPSYGLPAGLIFPCASRAHNALARTSHNPLPHNETYRRHHLFDDQKGFTRALSHDLQHSWKERRARHQASSGETGIERYLHSIARPKDRGGGGVGGAPVARPIIDLLIKFRGLFRRSLWVWTKPRAIVFRRGPASENLGRLVLKIRGCHE